MMKRSSDDDDDMCDRRGVRGRASSRSGNLKEDETDKQLQEIEETIPTGETTAASSHTKKKKRQTAHRRRQEQQQAEGGNLAGEEQKEEELLVESDDTDEDIGATTATNFTNDDAGAGTAGAFAIGQGGRQVRRGGSDAADNISLFSELETIRSSSSTPPPPEEAARADNDGDAPLVVAELADQSGHVAAEDFIALQEQVTSLQAGIYQAQAVRAVPASVDGGQNEQVNETRRIDGDDESAEEEPRYKRRRRRFIILVVVLLAIAAIVSILAGVKPWDNGGGGSPAIPPTVAPASETQQATGLVLNLVGLDTEFDESDSELWATATKAFVEEYFNTPSRRGLGSLLIRNLQVSNVQDVETTLQVTNTIVAQDGNGAEPSLQVVYSQAVTYAIDTSNNDYISMEVLATEPFKTSARRLAYVNDLQVAGTNAGSDVFDNLIGTTEVSTNADTLAPATPAPSPSPIIVLPNGPWNPVGQVLHGKAAIDWFGNSVSLSRDGSVMAIGADQRGSSNPGYVVVQRYNLSNKQWIQIAQELVGQAGGDRFGLSVSLNGDGTILTVGAPWNYSGGKSVGQVRVFEYDSVSDRWVQLGSDILGQDARDQFGFSVSLSDAGDILAVGADLDDTENGSGSGSVRLFQYNRSSSSWNQLGQTLIGQATADYFGISVSLNAQGTIVGVGAHWNDSGGNNAGQVSVYEYNSASSKWDPLGDSINGQVLHSLFGYSVSLDDSGLIVAAGAHGGSTNERVSVYSYDRSTLTWNQHGQTLLTQQPGNNFGWSVSLSGNGNVLAVGSHYHDVNGLTSAGQVRIFQHDSNADEWKQVGDPLNGEAEDDYFGSSVSLSADGSVVGVGAHEADINGDRSGSAYAFTVNNN